MKITVNFENGMELTLTPDNIQLVDNNGKETVAITRTENAIIPLVFFKALLATPDELKVREAKATAVKAEIEKVATIGTIVDAVSAGA